MMNGSEKLKVEEATNQATNIQSKQLINLPSYITENDIEKIITKELDWINSDEYIQRKMIATWMTRNAIVKDAEQIIHQFKKTYINFLSDSADLAFGAYVQNKQTPIINLYQTNQNGILLKTLDHEIKHALSEQSLETQDDLIKLFNSKYKKYPNINVKKWRDYVVPWESTSRWASNSPEQQAVSKRIMDIVEKTQWVKRWEKLTADNIKTLINDLRTSIKNEDYANSDIISLFVAFKAKFGKMYYEKIVDLVNNAY